jgi:hypothetical protein
MATVYRQKEQAVTAVHMSEHHIKDMRHKIREEAKQIQVRFTSSFLEHS